jgi:hypothetical protein
MTDVTASVNEHLQTILTNVMNNKTQIDNQIVQGEQQISVAKEQLATIVTLIATLQHCIDSGAAPAIAAVAAVQATNTMEGAPVSNGVGVVS